MSKNDKSEQKHWFLFSFYGHTPTGSVASACTGYRDKLITLGRIRENKAYVGFDENAVLLSVSYLGFMSREEMMRESDGTVPMTPIEWLIGEDTGISSIAILSVMTGCRVDEEFDTSVPQDIGDFGRCYRLLQIFPAWKERLHEVSDKYPHWEPIVESWPALTNLYEQRGRSGGAARFTARLNLVRRRPVS